MKPEDTNAHSQPVVGIFMDGFSYLLKDVVLDPFLGTVYWVESLHGPMPTIKFGDIARIKSSLARGE